MVEDEGRREGGIACNASSAPIPIPEKSLNKEFSLQRANAMSASLNNGLQNAHLLARVAVENDYVPDPQNSPQFPHHSTLPTPPVSHHIQSIGQCLERMDWIGLCWTSMTHPLPPCLNTTAWYQWNLVSALREEDLNLTLPLDHQPWYHGQISQVDADRNRWSWSAASRYTLYRISFLCPHAWERIILWFMNN